MLVHTIPQAVDLRLGVVSVDMDRALVNIWLTAAADLTGRRSVAVRPILRGDWTPFCFRCGTHRDSYR
jgi:hypothetical protein